MPPATPASILSSPDRRSWPAPGWSVAVADRASAVIVFILQGCRRRRPPSIGIPPGSHPGGIPEGIRIIPDPGQGTPAWPICRHGPRGTSRCRVPPGKRAITAGRQSRTGRPAVVRLPDMLPILVMGVRTPRCRTSRDRNGHPSAGLSRRRQHILLVCKPRTSIQQGSMAPRPRPSGPSGNSWMRCARCGSGAG